MHLNNTRSCFSMGRAITQVTDLVNKAAELGYKTVCLTDDATVSGMTDLFKTAKSIESGLKPVIGMSIKVFDRPTYRPPSKSSGEKALPNNFWECRLFVKNEAGLKALFALLTIARSEEYFYYEPRIGLRELISAMNSGGLIMTTGDFYSLFSHKHHAKIYKVLAHHVKASERVIELVPVKSAYFDRVNRIAAQTAKESDSRVMIGRPVLYSEDGMADARDVMSYIIGQGSAVHPLRSIMFNRDFHIYTPAELHQLTIDWRERLCIDLLNQTEEIFAECVYVWEKQDMCLPQMAEDEFGELVKLCSEGWKSRLQREIFGYMPPAEKLPVYRERLKYELGVLKSMKFDRYFLLIRDIINWSKANGIMVGPARGSAGGSLVAFLVGITDVDPIRFNLIFERFLNPDRLDYPDVDTDFMSSRRGEVIEYITKTYGEDRVAGISNYTTLGAASAIRDVARIHDLPQDDYRCTKVIDQGMSIEEAKELPEIKQYAAKYPMQFAISEQLAGSMRSLGRHAAGVVVAGEPLVSRAAVEKRNGEQTVNWDKQVVEEFGLIKLDILGLSTLDMISIAKEKIEKNHKIKLDLLSIPLDDERVLRAFGEGATAGVFQFVSPGMKGLLRDLAEGGRSLTFEDVYAATALFRPGPLQSGMTEEYVRIKQGIVKPHYPHPRAEEALRSTRGVMVFQEQTMQLSRDLAGFSMAESDKIRKAIGKKDAALMESIGSKFVEQAQAGWVTVELEDGTRKEYHAASISADALAGMKVISREPGLNEELAREIWHNIEVNGGYQFNASHSVAYTLISYLCMWLKVNYPAEFFAASLSIAKEDELPSIVKDAEQHKIYIVPPCVNRSSETFEIGYDAIREQHILYAPFNAVKGVSELGVKAILEAREKAGGSFKDKEHFIECVDRRRINKRVQETLDKVGAFAKIELGSLDPRHPDRLRDQKELLPNLMLRNVKASRCMPIDGYVESQLQVLSDDMRKLCQDEEGCSVGPQPAVPNYGKKPKFMFITDCAAHSEVEAGRFAEGKSFNYTLAALKEAGLKKSDGYYTALVKTKKADKQLTSDEIVRWSHFLDAELELLRPAIIVAAGGAIARHLCPDIKGGWEAIAGQTIYDVKRDCTIIFAPNPQMVYAKPDVQTVLDNIMCEVAEMLT